MNKFLFGNKNNRQIWIIFIVANLLYSLMIFMSIPHLQKLSQGLPILDIRAGGYTLEEVQALYTALGSEGRSYYLFPQLFFDIFYPGLFAVTYTWIIIRLLQQLSIQNKWLKGLCYLPLITSFFDYSENISIFITLKSYPELSPTLVQLGSVCTFLKNISGMMTFSVIIVLFLVWVVRKLGQNKSSN